MIITTQLEKQLDKLRELLQKLSKEQYIYKSKFLSNASIGGHTRHIIELLKCTIDGYDVERIDYINRERNVEIETNIALALEMIKQLIYSINLHDKILYVLSEDGANICSTYNRELLYNVEHIIHHFALIKVSLIELDANVVDDYFGVAFSTIQYKQTVQLS
jgi:hypothetical protein